MSTESEIQFEEAAQCLLRFAEHDDKDALEQCLRICVQPAYRQAYAELGNQADAHDASQEALLQLTRSAGRFQAERRLAPWLARHVTFACAHLRRSTQRRRRREQIAGREQERSMQQDQREQELDNAALDQEALEQLRAAVAQLKDKDRALISMHYFAEQSQAQVADALGISENAASVRIHRARGKLKRILEKQGMRADLALLPALLASAPLPPAQLLAQTLHCCSAAVLPSTTIPLTIIEKTTMLIQAHPIISLAATILLSVVGISSPLLWAADQAPVANPPGAVAGAEWNPAAQKLLAFHDPDALIQFAGDGPALRQLFLDTKPFTYLKTAAGKQLLLSWDQELRHYMQWGNQWTKNNYEILTAWCTLRGFMLQGDHAPYNPTSAVDIGRDTAAIMNIIKHENKAGKQLKGYQFYGDVLAVKGTTIVGGERGVKIPNETQPTPALQEYPAWFRLYPKHLLAMCAEHKQLFNNFNNYLGADWGRRDPQAQLHVERERDVLVLKGMVKELPANGLYLSAILLSEELFGTSRLPIAPVQLHPAQHLPAVSDKALMDLRFACDYTQHSALQQRLAEILQQRFQISALAAAWNGELLVAVQPGIPFPKPDIVVGLQGDLTQLAKQLDTLIDSMQAQGISVTAVDGDGSDTALVKAWSLFTPIGQIQITLAKDRLLISGDTDVTRLMQSQVAEHALSLRIDLPSLVETYGPILRSMLPLKQKTYLGKYVLGNTELHRQIISDLSVAKTMNRPVAEILSGDAYKTWAQQNSVAQCLSIWQHDSEQTPRKYAYNEVRAVFRTQTGWHFLDDPVYDDASPRDLQTIQQQLKGFHLVAGSKLEELQFQLRGPMPVIDWSNQLPSLTDLVSFMPSYELTWDRDLQGVQHFVEKGIPLTALLYASLGLSLVKMEPLREAEEAQAVKQSVLIFEQHAARFKALQKISVAMKDNTVRHPSDILSHVSTETLLALGLGKQPSAKQIDALGRWNNGVVKQYRSIRVYTADERMRGIVGQEVVAEIKWTFRLDAKHWIVLGPEVVGISSEENPLPASMKSSGRTLSNE